MKGKKLPGWSVMALAGGVLVIVAGTLASLYMPGWMAVLVICFGVVLVTGGRRFTRASYYRRQRRIIARQSNLHMRESLFLQLRKLPYQSTLDEQDGRLVVVMRHKLHHPASDSAWASWLRVDREILDEQGRAYDIVLGRFESIGSVPGGDVEHLEVTERYIVAENIASVRYRRIEKRYRGESLNPHYEYEAERILPTVTTRLVWAVLDPLHAWQGALHR